MIVSPHSPEQIRERAAELGLTLDLFQPFRDLLVWKKTYSKIICADWNLNSI